LISSTAGARQGDSESYNNLDNNVRISAVEERAGKGTLAFNIHQFLQVVTSRWHRILENEFKHPIIMRPLHKIAFLGVLSAFPMVPFPRIPLHSFLSTMVKVDELDVVFGNENIGAPDITVHEVAIMNDA